MRAVLNGHMVRCSSAFVFVSPLYPGLCLVSPWERSVCCSPFSLIHCAHPTALLPQLWGSEQGECLIIFQCNITVAVSGLFGMWPHKCLSSDVAFPFPLLAPSFFPGCHIPDLFPLSPRLCWLCLLLFRWRQKAEVGKQKCCSPSWAEVRPFGFPQRASLLWGKLSVRFLMITSPLLMADRHGSFWSFSEGKSHKSGCTPTSTMAPKIFFFSPKWVHTQHQEPSKSPPIVLASLWCWGCFCSG